MKALLQKLTDALAAGQAAVLVTVVASSGSTPRGAGARMLISEQGRLCGTIGGGAVEYRSEQLAREVLQSRRCRTENFTLRPDEVRDLGMVCGGEVSVYFHYLAPDNAAAQAVARAALTALEGGRPCWLVTEITPGGAGALTLCRKGEQAVGAPLPAAVTEALAAGPVQIGADGRTYYLEPLVRAGRVYIFGGGHVAQALAPALAAVDFRCVVLEDREDFCAPALFGGAAQTRLVRMDALADSAPAIGPEDYVCIMTRGHKDDLLCEAFALRSPACYIGVIGSRRKTATVNARLREMGFDDGDLARVSTPIGLAIGAETPAEIAVSIAAQMIAHRAARART